MFLLLGGHAFRMHRSFGRGAAPTTRGNLRWGGTSLGVRSRSPPHRHRGEARTPCQMGPPGSFSFLLFLALGIAVIVLSSGQSGPTKSKILQILFAGDLWPTQPGVGASRVDLGVSRCGASPSLPGRRAARTTHARFVSEPNRIYLRFLGPLQIQRLSFLGAPRRWQNIVQGHKAFLEDRKGP